jgi:hypothetical protein
MQQSNSTAIVCRRYFKLRVLHKRNISILFEELVHGFKPIMRVKRLGCGSLWFLLLSWVCLWNLRGQTWRHMGKDLAHSMGIKPFNSLLGTHGLCIAQLISPLRVHVPDWLLYEYSCELMLHLWSRDCAIKVTILSRGFIQCC